MFLTEILPALRQAAVRLVLPLAVVYGAMVGLGLLVTKVLDDRWPLTVENTVNQALIIERGGTSDTVSEFTSAIGSTPVIIAMTAVIAIALVLITRRWREPLFLAGAVGAQALVFLFTTLAIDRQRPAVEQLDSAPPTSSFPSGHTSAAVALYCAIALLLAVRARRTPVKVAWWTLLVAVPVGVALARLYRGMHHPTDVLGSFINAGCCVAIMARGVLDRTVRWGRDHVPGGRRRPQPVRQASRV